MSDRRRPHSGRSTPDTHLIRWLGAGALPPLEDTAEADLPALAQCLAARSDESNNQDILHLLRALRASRLAGLMDELTGLYNRAYFLRALTAAVEEVLRKPLSSSCMEAVFIDLDGFKALNDGCGHAAGDAALKEVAVRLRKAFRKRDVIARLGGDEFCLLIDSYAPHSDPPDFSIKARVEDALKGLVYSNSRGEQFHVGASVGVIALDRQSVRPFGNRPPAGVAADLLQEADRRMYADKHLRKQKA